MKNDEAKYRNLLLNIVQKSQQETYLLNEEKGDIMEETTNYEINYNDITVRTSDGSVITGKVNITHFKRLSDMVKNSPDKFLTIVSENTEDGSKWVNIINKEYIVSARAPLK